MYNKRQIFSTQGNEGRLSRMDIESDPVGVCPSCGRTTTLNRHLGGHCSDALGPIALLLRLYCKNKHSWMSKPTNGGKVPRCPKCNEKPTAIIPAYCTGIIMKVV